jgi:hypothetical protein
MANGRGKSYSVTVLWPVEGLKASALPSVVADVRFAMLDQRKRTAILKVVAKDRTDPRRQALIEHLADFNESPHAEVLVQADAPNVAEVVARQRIEAVIEVINFFADIGDVRGQGIYLASTQGHGPTDSLGYGTDPNGQPHWQMTFAQSGPHGNVSLAALRKHANFGTAVRMLSKSAPTEAEARFLMALRWAGRASIELNPTHSLSFYVFSLEALLVGPNPGGDIGYKVAVRCSSLLARTADGKSKIYEKVKSLYKLRSSVVHRGKFEGIHPRDVLLARAYAKAAAIKVLSQRQLLRKLKKDSDLNDWLDKLVLGVPAIRSRKPSPLSVQEGA